MFSACQGLQSLKSLYGANMKHSLALSVVSTAGHHDSIVSKIKKEKKERKKERGEKRILV